jgi:cytosine deaminase
MLVLARQRDETIIIGDEVEVTVVDIRGDKVRLGINAPRTVSVHRKEIYDAIRRENREAAKLRPQDVPDLDKARPGIISTQMKIAGADSVDRAAHEPYLKAAVEEARLGMKEGGLPIGSVLVRDGQIVSRGHNRRVQNGDPMAHAEIDALTKAGRQKTYRNTTLYSTLMPCYLCSGAAVQFGVPRVVVGESVNFPGAPDFMRSRGIEVIDLHDQECTQMMAEFIREHPELWNEDIGGK